MAKYLLTNKAVEDLTKIWNYTYEVWSENQADKYYELLINSFDEIANDPAIGKNYDEIHSAILGFAVGKHIVFYQVVDSDSIKVIRILHQRMDLKNRMEE